MSELYVETYVEFKNEEYAEAIRLAIRQFSPELSPQEDFRREIKRFTSVGIDATHTFTDSAKDANIKGATRLDGAAFTFTIHSIGGGAYEFWQRLYDLLERCDISFLASVVFVEQSGGCSIYYTNGSIGGVYHIGERGETDVLLNDSMKEGNVFELIEQLYQNNRLPKIESDSS